LIVLALRHYHQQIERLQFRQREHTLQGQNPDWTKTIIHRYLDIVYDNDDLDNEAKQ
jgi:hypothetical protein